MLPILTVLLGTTVSISIISNIICICVIRITNFTSVRRVLLLSLSVADLAIGIFSGVPSLASAIVKGWPFPQWFCWMEALTNVQFNVTSLLCVLALNIDRYIAISKPLLYSSIATYRRAIVVVTACWVLSFIWALLEGVLPGRYATYLPDSFSCSFDSQNGTDWHGFITIASFICIPAVFSLILSYKIWKIARHHTVQLKVLSTVANQNPRVKVKATFMLILINLFFLLAWFPVVVASAIDEIIPKSLSQSVGLFVSLSTTFHICTNIFVYYWNNKSFRESVKKLVKMR